jgi:phage gp46-like protein
MIQNNYDGDALLTVDPETGEIDITYKNGQPKMTQGFETCLLLSIFGEDCALNGMTTDTNEKFTSTFPEVIRRKRVSETVKNDGIKAIERSLAYMVQERMASSVSVTGTILGVHAIGWGIEITAPDGTGRKYELNWINGGLTFGYRDINTRGGA